LESRAIPFSICTLKPIVRNEQPTNQPHTHTHTHTHTTHAHNNNNYIHDTQHETPLGFSWSWRFSLRCRSCSGPWRWWPLLGPRTRRSGLASAESCLGRFAEWWSKTNTCCFFLSFRLFSLPFRQKKTSILSENILQKTLISWINVPPFFCCFLEP